MCTRNKRSRRRVELEAHSLGALLHYVLLRYVRHSECVPWYVLPIARLLEYGVCDQNAFQWVMRIHFVQASFTALPPVQGQSQTRNIEATQKQYFFDRTFCTFLRPPRKDLQTRTEFVLAYVRIFLSSIRQGIPYAYEFLTNCCCRSRMAVKL